MKDYYLPRGDKERSAWLKNFALKFAGIATTLGFTAADATAVTNDSNAFAYMLDLLEVFKREQRERTAYKDILGEGPLGSTLGAIPAAPTLPAAPPAVPAGIFPRITAIVRRIKAHTNYTEAIGHDLGIIGAEGEAEKSTQQPSLKLSKDAKGVLIKYVKGNAHGIQLFSKRGSETTFTLLGTVTKTTYTDTRLNVVPTQPETRVYQAVYIKDDEPTGQPSQDASIVV